MQASIFSANLLGTASGVETITSGASLTFLFSITSIVTFILIGLFIYSVRYFYILYSKIMSTIATFFIIFEVASYIFRTVSLVMQLKIPCILFSNKVDITTQKIIKYNVPVGKVPHIKKIGSSAMLRRNAFDLTYSNGKCLNLTDSRLIFTPRRQGSFRSFVAGFSANFKPAVLVLTHRVGLASAGAASVALSSTLYQKSIRARQVSEEVNRAIAVQEEQTRKPSSSGMTGGNSIGSPLEDFNTYSILED